MTVIAAPSLPSDAASAPDRASNACRIAPAS